VGRLLNLPYPGGPHIDRVSSEGNPEAFQFPRAILDGGYNFSFSGLKTSVLRIIKKYNPNQLPIADLAASFQAAVVDVLVKKTQLAAETYQAKAVHLTGGVSANQALRQAMQQQLDIPVRYPPLILCTDNAAMIGAAAHWHFLAKKSTSLGVDVIPSLSIV
jgi:N6-L-threonylcarbamoyladenine synthase